MSLPPEPLSSLRFALVGCGRIAQSHLEALTTLDEAALVAVVEPREAVGRAEAERRKCEYFGDYRDPGLQGAVDVAIVCSPPDTHHAIARHFLENGVDVLCEKPLTLAARDAEALVKLAGRHRRKLMMASKFRYVDDVIKAKSLVESGILGNIVLYENTFCSKVPMADRWNSQKAVSGGGVLIDNGSHSVDIARYLLGALAEVQTQTGLSVQGLEVEETVRMHFRTRARVMGTVDLSWSINKESDWYISLYGTEGTLHVGWKGSRYRQNGSPVWVQFGTGYDKTRAFRRQIENLIGVIRGREMPVISPEDALASVQVIEAAYVSASRDYWVQVGAPDA